MLKTMITLVTLLVLLPTGSFAQTTITGFVDSAYFYETSARNGEFGIDQVEIDVEHAASDETMLRADVEWIKDGEGFVAQVEQAFATWTSPLGCMVSLGKFNAPMGFELLDPPDMFQYSHSLLFDFAIPTNLTGLRIARDLGGGVDAVAHVSNGWDRETADANVTFGGRLGYTHGGFAGGISAISGREEGEPDIEGDPLPTLRRTVLDVDLGYVVENWTFGGEFNRGDATLNGNVDAGWTAAMGMAHVDLTDRYGVTVRYDWFDDADGFVFGPVGGEVQTRQSITLAPTLVLDDGFGVIVEFRMDTSDQDAFLDSDGEPTDTTTSVAVEATYVW